MTTSPPKNRPEPKTAKPLKAFEVREDWYIGQAEIVWATCHAAARREVLGELGMEFNQVSAKRVPELDDFKGDIEHWKFENGWWSACEYRGCNNERVSQETGIYDHGFFCSQEHCGLERARVAAEKQKIANACEAAESACPGIKIDKAHVFVNVAGEVMMGVTFPSGRYVNASSDFFLTEEAKNECNMPGTFRWRDIARDPWVNKHPLVAIYNPLKGTIVIHRPGGAILGPPGTKWTPIPDLKEFDPP